MNVRLFEAMADLLIPSAADMPSASQAAVGTTGLSQVLSFRPELRSTIEAILKQCEGKSANDALKSLSAADFGTLAEVVASAYFMNEDVRTKLHYHGQRAKPIVPEEIDPALLKSVIDRGPIYRTAS
jgi:CBS-domain-containing membrane protein